MARKIALDYDKIAYWSRRLVSQKNIASRSGFTEAAFSRRKKRDPQLKEALEGGYDDGKIGLEIALYRQSLEHHYTMCGDCHKIADAEFYESCPYCDKSDPDEAGHHTNVKHRIEKGDPQILLHMAAHHLGQTKKSLIEIQGSATHPLMFQNMSKEMVEEKIRKILPYLNEEFYGCPSKERPQVVEIVPPDADADL